MTRRGLVVGFLALAGCLPSGKRAAVGAREPSAASTAAPAASTPAAPSDAPSPPTPHVQVVAAPPAPIIPPADPCVDIETSRAVLAQVIEREGPWRALRKKAIAVCKLAPAPRERVAFGSAGIDDAETYTCPKGSSKELTDAANCGSRCEPERSSEEREHARRVSVCGTTTVPTIEPGRRVVR